jgi:hypothetical protein
MERWQTHAVFAAGPLGNWFGQATPAYHQAALEHPFHYIMKWAWYEWLGIVGPIPILWWMGKAAEKKGEPTLTRLCRGLIIYDLIYWAAACLISIPAKFEMLARLQPLRSFHYPGGCLSRSERFLQTVGTLSGRERIPRTLGRKHLLGCKGILRKMPILR